MALLTLHPTRKWKMEVPGTWIDAVGRLGLAWAHAAGVIRLIQQ